MTEPTEPKLQAVLIIMKDEDNKCRVCRAVALVLTSEIWIDEIDEKGKSWLKKWWELGSISSNEITIKSKPSPTEPRNILFQGFLAFSYLNPYAAPDKTQKTIERFVAGLRFLQPFKGTPLHRNWTDLKLIKNIWYTEEWIIYSDSRFAGEIKDFGPYQILNTVARDESVMVGALVFRADIHRSFSVHEQYIPKELSKNHRDFRGYRERIIISFCGEMTAILSVATGKRLIEGNSIRMFGHEFYDGMGRPYYPGSPPHVRRPEHPILPYYSHTDAESLAPAKEMLNKYLHLHKHDAATFLRSARLYQKALLQCDEDPNLAWLWCVGAIETLAEVPGETVGVQQKFLDLLEQNLPAPPPIRPPHNQVDWSDLAPSFQQIYNYRSQFLHAGFPFPIPMTRRPADESQGQGLFGERPHGGLGFGTTTFESWASPMHFHVFLYIVRGAMLKWLDRTYEATRGVQDEPDGSGEGEGEDFPEENSRGYGSPI